MNSELKEQRLAHRRWVYRNNNASRNRAKVTTEQAELMGLACFCLPPKAFVKFLKDWIANNNLDTLKT